jgi:hypothetical protein
MDSSIGPIKTYEYLIIAFPGIKVIQKDVYNTTLETKSSLRSYKDGLELRHFYTN